MGEEGGGGGGVNDVFFRNHGRWLNQSEPGCVTVVSVRHKFNELALRW